MDKHQHEALLNMFHQMRLQPQIPEHYLFIQGQLAMLKVLDKHDYDSFKDFYDQKKEQYEASLVKTEEVKEEVKEEVSEKVVEKKKKKPGRKKKNS